MLVSIIIPCYNVEDYVAECLDSAINQTYRPIEIITVDNNSMDCTLSILKDYECKYPDLITVLEEKKQGAPAARNKGMSVAKGEWLQFLDADDLLLKNKIENQIKLIKTNNTDVFMIAGAHVHKYLSKKSVVSLPNEGNAYKAVIQSDIGYTVSNLFRRVNDVSQPVWNCELLGAQDANFIFDYLKKFGEQMLYDHSVTTITRERSFGQITKSNPAIYYGSCIAFQLDALQYLKNESIEFYQLNKTFFLDNLYYTIYSAALSDIEFGTEKLKELIPMDYFPDHKRENRITFIHSLGFKFLGFEKYVRVRKFFIDHLGL